VTITFCGHSDFCFSAEYEEILLGILEKEVGDKEADILLGGYGAFDEFA